MPDISYLSVIISSETSLTKYFNENANIEK